MPNRSQFYFAWVASTETTFNSSHLREDELIYSFELKHEEGQFAELELEIANPYVGLLAAGRPLWAWFSWWDGTSVHPLLFGRLIGIPDDLFGDIIKIRLVARPLSYQAQRVALANTLKVLPYYDPLFIDDSKLDDPDSVLDGYSKLWHVDRISHLVTVSDIIDGEDGVVSFAGNEAFYDSVKMKISGAPLLVCQIETEVGWTQCDGTGVFEMKALPNTEQPVEKTGPIFGGVKWPPYEQPKPPQDQTQVTFSWEYKNITAGPHSDGDLMEESGSYTDPFYGGDMVKQDKHQQNADKETGQGEEYSIRENYVYTYMYYPPTPDAPDGNSGGGGGNAADAATAQQLVAVEVEQDRKEAMYAAMRADVQPVLVDVTENQEDLIESLSLSTRDPVAAGIISTSAGAYFATHRGQQSVEYMLMVARAHLLSGSRIVEVEWESPMAKVVGLSCRMSAVLNDPRMPGGAALGKIVAYTMSCNGDNGELLGAVTINCSVGNGALGRTSRAVAAVDGIPAYVDVGYVDAGYQYYVGQMVVAATDDFTYSPLEVQAVGLQLPITQDQILVRHEYHDGNAPARAAEAMETAVLQLSAFQFPPYGTMIDRVPAEVLQRSAAGRATSDIIAQAFHDNPSWVEVEFKPTRGISARADYAADVGSLVMPKHINLSRTHNEERTMAVMERIVRPHLPYDTGPTTQPPKCRDPAQGSSYQMKAPPNMANYARSSPSKDPPKVPDPQEKKLNSAWAYAYKKYMTKKEKEISKESSDADRIYRVVQEQTGGKSDDSSGGGGGGGQGSDPRGGEKPPVTPT